MRGVEETMQRENPEKLGGAPFPASLEEQERGGSERIKKHRGEVS